MKKILPVITIAILLCSYLSQANSVNRENDRHLKSGKLFAASEKPLKSVVEYKINNSQAVSVNTQSMLNKSVMKEDSVLYAKTEISYMANHTEMNFFEWRPTGWKPEGKYTFYHKSNIEFADSTISFSYDSIKSVYVYQAKTIYFKNAAGKDTSEIGYEYDSNTKKWLPGWRTTYTYNAGGMILTEITYSWNDEQNNWELVSKFSYTYSGGLEIVSEYFMWAETEWFGFSKTETSYYPDNQIKSTTDYTLDFFTFGYLKTSMVKYSYSNSVPDTIMFFNWEDDKWNVTMFDKDNYISGSNQVKSTDSYILSTNKSASEVALFTKESVTIYNYDDDNTGVLQNQLAETRIYPNPVNDYLNIFIKNPQNSQIGIYDLQGRLMKSEIILNENTKIGVNDLSHGVYLIRVQNNGNHSVQKLVKN